MKALIFFGDPNTWDCGDGGEAPFGSTQPRARDTPFIDTFGGMGGGGATRKLAQRSRANRFEVSKLGVVIGGSVVTNQREIQ